jgi:hypothetical protein
MTSTKNLPNHKTYGVVIKLPWLASPLDDHDRTFLDQPDAQQTSRACMFSKRVSSGDVMIIFCGSALNSFFAARNESRSG